MIDAACNDCRNTVAGCPVHVKEEEDSRRLASEIIRELIERDAPEEDAEEAQEDGG